MKKMNLKIRPQDGPVGSERLLVREGCQGEVPDQEGQHPLAGQGGGLVHPVERDLVDYRPEGLRRRGVREVYLGQVDSVLVGCQEVGRVRRDGLEGPEAGSDLVDYQVQVRVRPDALVAHHVAVVFWTTTITKTTSLCAQVDCLAAGRVLEDCLVERRAAQVVYRVAGLRHQGVLV